ncbi:protein of unknown function (plasmid) [Caballeronia sp. S22]
MLTALKPVTPYVTLIHDRPLDVAHTDRAGSGSQAAAACRLRFPAGGGGDHCIAFDVRLSSPIRR